MNTWTAYYFEKTNRDDRPYHWVALTNCDSGKPDGYICITQGFGDLPELLDIFGHKSRVHEGREISVFVDGVKQ